MVIVIYRGHKDADYLKSRYRALSFTENKDLAISYGMGLNDAGNIAVSGGFLTIVEFHGEIFSVAENGLGNIDRYIDKYLKFDAVKFRDGVIAVLRRDKLCNAKTIRAASSI